MILRELDIDITPVLTGAGIAGLAIGFGAQTLVRDVISGFFLIFEDQVRVGDVVMVNGQGGLVEEVNLRTIVLRDETGGGPHLPQRRSEDAVEHVEGLLVLRHHRRRGVRRRRRTRHRCDGGSGRAA